MSRTAPAQHTPAAIAISTARQGVQRTGDLLSVRWSTSYPSWRELRDTQMWFALPITHLSSFVEDQWKGFQTMASRNFVQRFGPAAFERLEPRALLAASV